MNSGGTYVFKDINAVVDGEETPKETAKSREAREKPATVLRRRWRQLNEVRRDADQG